MAIARVAEPSGSLAGGQGVGPRPRGPAPDLPQHAPHARGRGARAHPLPPGKDPGLVLHRPRQRGPVGRRRDGDGAATTSARRSTATWASTSRAASSRGGSSPTTWAASTGRPRAATATCTWPTSRLGLIAMVSHLPAMLPVAVGCALAFRIREEKRVAVGWFGEGASARGDTHEAMNFAGVRAAAGRLHLRQQPVGLLDADAPRVRGRAPRRPRAGIRLRGRRRRRHRRARRLPRGEARDREGARGRRPDADRVPDAPDGGPRRPRRRVLRPEGALRGVGGARPARALPHAGCASTPS